MSKIHLHPQRDRAKAGKTHRNVTSGWVRILRSNYRDMRRNGASPRKARRWIYSSLIVGQHATYVTETVPQEAVGAF